MKKSFIRIWKRDEKGLFRLESTIVTEEDEKAIALFKGKSEELNARVVKIDLSAIEGRAIGNEFRVTLS